MQKMWDFEVETKTIEMTRKREIDVRMLALLTLVWTISIFNKTSSVEGTRNDIPAVNISYILNSFQIGYDRRVRPNYGGIPVTVGVSLYILSIGDLSEKFMDFTFDMYFRQFWTDPRWGDVFNCWNLKASLGWPFRDKTIWKN